MKNKILIPAMLMAVSMLLFWSCKKPSEAPIAKDPTVFDDADAQAVVAIAKELPVGKDIALDFSNEHHYRFWKKQLYLGGATEETHPELFNQLERTRAEHVQNKGVKQSVQDTPAELATGVSQITAFVGTPATGQFSTSGMLSYPMNSLITATLSIGLYNKSGHVIGQPSIASGYTPTQLARLAVESEGNATGTDSIYSMYAYMYQDRNGAVHHNILKAVTANIVDTIVNVAPMPCVLNTANPACANQNCTNNTITRVCMSRNGTDCTYCYTGTAYSLMFPLVGSIEYSGNVNVDGNNKPNDGAFASVTLTRLPAGGGCPAIPASQNLLDYVTVTGKKLSWNLSPANFNNTCLAHGDTVLFQMTIFVMVGTEPAFATISNAPNVDPPALRIPRIQIVSGCLAEGTRITLADGKAIPIEKVPMNAQVKTPDNKPLFVDFNTTGTEKDPAVRITTDKGHNVLMTEAHPVVTPDGTRMAKELKQGDKVVTDKGDATITALSREAYTGTVWNLAVSPPGDEAYNGELTTFYANGILVGDHKMQNYARYKPWSHEETLQKLPKSWHQDYLNARNGQKKN